MRLSSYAPKINVNPVDQNEIAQAYLSGRYPVKDDPEQARLKSLNSQVGDDATEDANWTHKLVFINKIEKWSKKC